MTDFGSETWYGKTPESVPLLGLDQFSDEVFASYTGPEDGLGFVFRDSSKSHLVLSSILVLQVFMATILCCLTLAHMQKAGMNILYFIICISCFVHISVQNMGVRLGFPQRKLRMLHNSESGHSTQGPG